MNLRNRPSIGKDMAVAGIVFLLGFLFLPSLSFEFLNWDDRYYIHMNGWLLNLSWSNAIGVFVHPYFSNYHPLTMLSYMVDYHFFGLQPEGYRFENIVLHAATCVLSFAVMRVLGAQRIVAGMLAAIFAVHPLRIESVVWISERKDVLCNFFYVLAFLLWIIPTPGNNSARRLALWGVFACAVLALLAKPMAVTLPFVLLLFDAVWRRKSNAPRVALCAVLVALSIVLALVNQAAQEKALVANFPLWERLKVAAWSPVHYVIKTIVPYNLSPLYPYESRPTAQLPSALLGFLCSAGLVAAGIALIRRAPAIAFAILGGLLVLGPVSGVVAFGAAYAADRYSYLPTLVFLFGIAAAATPLLGDPRRRFAFASVGVVLLISFSAVSLSVMMHWQSSATLWARVLAIYPDSAKAQTNAIHARATEGAPDEASGIDAPPALQSNTQISELTVSSLVKERKFAEAMAAAKKISDKPTSLYWQASVARATNDLETALRVAKEMAHERKAPARQRAAVALALAALDQREAAIAILDTIDEPTVDGAAAWGQIARFTRNPNARVEAAERALAIFPAEFTALQALVVADPPTSLSHATAKALMRAARHPAADQSTRVYAWARLGAIAQKEDSVLAHEYFTKAFDIHFPDRMGKKERAQVLAYAAYQSEELKHDTHIATQLYVRALEFDPVNIDALQNLAILCIRIGKRKEALELLTTASEHYPDDPTIAANLARLKEDLARDGAN